MLKKKMKFDRCTPLLYCPDIFILVDFPPVVHIYGTMTCTHISSEDDNLGVIYVLFDIYLESSTER